MQLTLDQIHRYFEHTHPGQRIGPKDKASVKCALHDDQTPSCTLFLTGNGGFHCNGCNAGGNVFQHAAKLYNISVGDAETKVAEITGAKAVNYQNLGPAVACYDYRDANGVVLYQKRRFEPEGQPKTFRIFRADGKGGWSPGIDPKGDQHTRRVLYNLPQLVTANVTLIAEGEKDADRLAELNLFQSQPQWRVCATTDAFGAWQPGQQPKWLPEYSPFFAGKAAIVFEDNDEPGRTRARHIAQTVLPLAGRVKVVSFPELPEHGDVSDWLAAGHTAADLERYIKDAPDFRDTEDPTEVAQLGLKLKCGNEIIERRQDWLIDDFLPADTLVVVAGAPGVGKTTACLSWAASITNGKFPILETGRQPGNVLMLSNEDSEAGLRSIFTRLGGNLSRLYVEDEDSDHPWGIGDIPSLAAQMERLNPGLVIIDSLTTHTPAKADMNSHGDMAVLLVALRKLAVSHSCTIILIHHTNKLQTGNALARISGSIGISATARHVLLVAPHPEDDTTRVIAVAKSNLVLPGKVSLNFSLDPFSWNGTSTLSGDDLVRVNQEDEDGSPSEAEQFLRDALTDGRQDSATLIRQAESGYAIRRRTLQRAASKLGVIRETAGFGSTRRVYWSLAPTSDAREAAPSMTPVIHGVIDGGTRINTGDSERYVPMDDTSLRGCHPCVIHGENGPSRMIEGAL